VITNRETLSNTRVAHLLLVHKSPRQVGRLVKRLQHPFASIYIHVDAKIPIEPFRNAMLEIGAPNVEFIVNRYRINWSAFSMVEATIASLKYITAVEKYDFLNLLSGEDYPIKSSFEFHSFLNNHRGQSFMEFQKSGDLWWEEAQIRFKRFYLNDFTWKGRYFVEKVVNKLAGPRRPPKDLAIVGKSQWFTLAVPHLLYVLENEKELYYLRRFFKYSWAPDEFFFQTMLYNSPYRENIINDNLRYINWNGGKSSPKILTTEDLTVLKASRKFFARKFNADIDYAVLDHLDEWNL